jgi:hypothetical protein
MPENNIGTCINQGVRKVVHVTPVLSVKHLMCPRNGLVLTAFSTAMKRNDDNLAQ